METSSLRGNPIPDFDHNLVIPPHRGNPARPEQLSPYDCNTLEMCQKFATTKQRVELLKSFLAFRKRIYDNGVRMGYQWIDGSFLENVELRDRRPPNDIDVVTVFWGYSDDFLIQLKKSFPEFCLSKLAKERFKVDHFPFDAGASPELTLEQTRYWILLFSHNRLGVWKGMLKIKLDTATDDAEAESYLSKLSL